jgi:hypothetical protein
MCGMELAVFSLRATTTVATGMKGKEEGHLATPSA